MNKQTTTLYLRKDIVARCKELGINMSEACNKILEIVLEQPGISDEEIKLAILLAEKKRLGDEMKSLQINVEQQQRLMDSIEQKITQQRAVVSEVLRSNEIAVLIRQLNQRIKDANYDIVIVQESCQDILTSLRKLGIPTDKPEWLEMQIQRVKRLTP